MSAREKKGNSFEIGTLEFFKSEAKRQTEKDPYQTMKGWEKMGEKKRKIVDAERALET